MELVVEKKVGIDHELNRRILSFIASIFDLLNEPEFVKFTIPINATLAQRPKVHVTSEMMGSQRETTQIIPFETQDGAGEVHLTQVLNISSSIPMVYLAPGSLQNQIMSLIQQSLPEATQIADHVGSVYLIVSRQKTGPLWRVHQDSHWRKLHIVLTDCVERFEWYEDISGSRLLKSIQMMAGHSYFIDVQKYHTAVIEKYIGGLPRVHIVVDLKSEYVEKI